MMRSPRRQLDKYELGILEALHGTLVDGRGWKRRGVRGWLLYPELDQMVKGWINETLRWLAHHDLVTREIAWDVPPAKPRLAICRITEQGARVLASVSERSAVEFDEPGELEPNVFFLSEPRWAVLKVLQSGYPRAPTDWAPISEVRQRSQVFIYHETLDSLVLRGLIERRSERRNEGNPSVFLRATPLGMRVQIFDEGTGKEFVEVQLRDEQASVEEG